MKTWRSRGECNTADPALFFSDLEFENDTSAEYAAHVADVAYRYCNNCPVQMDCLRSSLEGAEEFGIFGGVGKRERRSLLRRFRNGGLALKCVDCGAQLSPAALRSRFGRCLFCAAEVAA